VTGPYDSRVPAGVAGGRGDEAAVVLSARCIRRSGAGVSETSRGAPAMISWLKLPSDELRNCIGLFTPNHDRRPQMPQRAFGIGLSSAAGGSG